MRKKYLSALLFGALLFASAGTFTSCKDYDDDINNLQSQITDVKNAVAELQKAIDNGKYVSDVVAEGTGLKVTWNDGSTTTISNVINEETGTSSSVITIDPTTGEVLMNGEGTGFFLSKGVTKAPYVNDNGVLVLIDENGKEVETGIRVAPVTAVENEDHSFTLTIIAADGTSQKINIPSAASSITDLVVSGEKNGIIELSFNNYKFGLADNSDVRKGWNGAKSLPASGTNIVRTVEPDGFGLRINPITIDASEVDFTLVNSANVALPGIEVTAAPDNSVLAGTPDSRTASKGGIYSLSVNDLLLDKNTVMSNWSANLLSYGEKVNFALTANGSARSKYNIQGEFNDNQNAALTNIGLWYNNQVNDQNGGTADVTLEKNVTYPIVANNKEALYDMMISADAEAISNYGLVIDKENYTIKITKDADVSTEGEFTFTVKTITVNGAVKTFTYNVTLSNKINTPAEYKEISHAVNSQDNFFAIDLSTMKEAMSAEELNTWKTRVNLASTAYTIHKKNADGSVGDEVTSIFGANNLLNAIISDKNTKDATAVSEKDKANYIVVKVNNDEAGALTLFTTYYIKVVFKTGGDELNTIVVPVNFTAPTVAEQFKVKSGLEKDGVVYGFFNTALEGAKQPAYKLSEAFTSIADGATFATTADLIEGLNNIPTNNTSKGVKIDNGVISFYQALPKEANKTQDAYGKVLTLQATSGEYKNWPYATDAQKLYKFKMALLSPIYSGTFNANGTIKVNGGEAFTITNAQLNVKDYNGTSVNILHDAIAANKTTSTFSDNRIATTKATGVSGQITSAEVVDGSVTNGKLTEGTISGRAASVVSDAESKITITVTDAFGYIKSFELPVTVTAAK